MDWTSIAGVAIGVVGAVGGTAYLLRVRREMKSKKTAPSYGGVKTK